MSASGYVLSTVDRAKGGRVTKHMVNARVLPSQIAYHDRCGHVEQAQRAREIYAKSLAWLDKHGYSKDGKKA